MVSRFRIAVGLVLLFALGILPPVFAGGWAVVTLDELPSKVTADEPLTVGFTVLQHGKTPMTGLKPTITARLAGSEEMVVFAEPEGSPGHYAAILTFPKEGDWEWSIQAFTMDQAMPALSVAPPIVPSSIKVEPQSTSLITLAIIRTLALGIGLTALALAFRRRTPLAVALTALSLLVGFTSFMTEAGRSSARSEVDGLSIESKSGLSAEVSPVELGRRLFLAKGCITCHYNSKAADKYWTIEMGAPNLSNFSASPEALRLRLKDPASVKSDTKMPNLGLSDVEIEALIAFINSK